MWETFSTWLHEHESVAIWLEGIALVAIFILDWKQRKDQRKDREEQHRETLKQMDIMQSHADASRDNAIAAKDSFEREWLPHWHLTIQNVDRGVTRLNVFN